MSLTDWSEYSTVPHYLRDEETPYSLPIVVRVEKDESLIPSHEEALLATAHGVVKFFADDRTVNGEWVEPVSTWLNGRIRKVARRAKGSQWDKAVELGGIVSTYGKAQVLILPPHPVDEAPAAVKRLQVAGLDLERQPLTEAHNNGLFVSLNPEIPMTTGKSLAQIGHAVQLTIFNETSDSLQKWEHNGFPITLTDWVSREWDIEIRDAGFTEVPAGSVTAKAVLV